MSWACWVPEDCNCGAYTQHHVTWRSIKLMVTHPYLLFRLVPACAIASAVCLHVCRCNDINMEFKAASMARTVSDKTEHSHASREAFKARGAEHAFALNSQC